MTTTLTTSSPSLVVNNHHSHNNNNNNHHHQSTASINNNINSNNTTTTNTNNTANGDDSCKKYTLVKWLENSQFDVRNEWLGRLHSVPHANIIDYDADELRPGMEISVFHNNGEIWRAQVIVPKTVNSTTLTSIDLQQQQRFNDKLGNNKNGGSGLQLKQELIHHTLDAVPIHHNHHHHHHHLATFVDLTDFNSAGTGSSSSTTTTSLEDMDTDQVQHHQQSSPSKSSHTASSGGQLLKNTSTSTPLSNTIMLLTNAPSQGASNSNSSNQNSQNVTIANNLDSNLAKMNKELQFLQTAINEAGLTDLYHSSNAASNAVAATSNGHHHHQQQQQQQQQITTLMASTAGDMTNIETILAMQCELLEHQKELKQIEYEQIEQLRQLHSNLNRLAKKFDSFETIVTSVNNGSLKLNKSNLNKLNNSIQHIKILDSELSKDLFGTSVTTGGGIGGTSNLNISGNGGTTWSLCSPQQLAGIIQTTNTNTATATPILQNLTLLNSAATAQPIELTGNGGNYIITSQLVNPGQKQMNDICFLDPSGTVSNGGQTLKLVGQVDLSSNSASNKPTTLTLLDAAQPQFSELKTVGLLQGADTFLKLNSHTNLNGTANNTTTTTTNNTGLNNENSSTSISEKNKTQGIQTQMALNRFLREAVKQRMGVEFLINNAVSDIPSNVMRQIKKEAFEKYLPNDRRPIKAWGLAMASLRCLKRDLVKNRNKQLANQGGRQQQQQPPTNFSNMLTSNAFGLSQVEVVTTTTGGNSGGAENANSSLDHHITATSSPLAPSKPAGRRGGATIRELELNARRF